MTSVRYVFTTPRATDQAIDADDIAEARSVLSDEREFGRLLGRLEAVVLMALSACAGACVWLVIS